MRALAPTTCLPVTCLPVPDRQRVSANFSFFATNYLMICATCSAVYILRSPGLLLTLLVSVCMFLYVFMSRRKTLVVLDVTLGTREKTIAAAAGTHRVAVYVCFDPIFSRASLRHISLTSA